MLFFCGTVKVMKVVLVTMLCSVVRVGIWRVVFF